MVFSVVYFLPLIAHFLYWFFWTSDVFGSWAFHGFFEAPISLMFFAGFLVKIWQIWQFPFMVFFNRPNSGILGILGYPHFAAKDYIKEMAFMVFCGWWEWIWQNVAKSFNGFFARPDWGMLGYPKCPDFADFGRPEFPKSWFQIFCVCPHFLIWLNFPQNFKNLARF